MAADEHLRQWLAEGMTGCQFAKLLAQDRARIVRVTFPGLASAEDVTRVFQLGAAGRLPAIAIFTGIRTEEQLVEQLTLLAGGDHWTITEEHPDGLVTDDVLVGIDWRVRDGLASSIMGLAPFATMPVTRRSPYVCLAGWPGEHDNPHWKKFDPGIVHFLDTDVSALELNAQKYRSLNKASIDATKELLSELGDDAGYYRRAAFRLQASVGDSLRRTLSRG